MEIPINLPGLMVYFIKKVATVVTQGHSLPSGFLLSTVLNNLGDPIASFEHYTSYDAFDYFEMRGIHRLDLEEAAIMGQEHTVESVLTIFAAYSTTYTAIFEIQLLQQKNTMLR